MREGFCSLKSLKRLDFVSKFSIQKVKACQIKGEIKATGASKMLSGKMEQNEVDLHKLKFEKSNIIYIKIALKCGYYFFPTGAKLKR